MLIEKIKIDCVKKFSRQIYDEYFKKLTKCNQMKTKLPNQNRGITGTSKILQWKLTMGKSNQCISVRDGKAS